MRPLKRMLAYGSVNAVLLPLNLAIAWALTEIGVQYLLATIAGFIVHLTLEFFINRRWTFQRLDLAALSGLTRALCVQLSALVVVVMTTWVGVEMIEVDFVYSRGLAVVTAGVWCYGLDCLFTFRVQMFR
jgi:putative flippase GtrA